MHPEPELWENRQLTLQEAFISVKSHSPMIVSALSLIVKVSYPSAFTVLCPKVKNEYKCSHLCLVLLNSERGRTC